MGRPLHDVRHAMHVFQFLDLYYFYMLVERLKRGHKNQSLGHRFESP